MNGGHDGAARGATATRYACAILEAAEEARVGVVVGFLAPPMVAFANRAAAELFGLSVDELRASSPLALVAPEDRPAVAARLARRVAGEHPETARFRIVRADGTLRNVEYAVGEVALDGRPAAAMFVTDVTEREASRRVVARADETYRALVDAAPDGVAITREGRFLYANHAAVQLLGLATSAEARGRSIGEFLAPDDLSVMIDRTRAMIATGARFPARDYTVRRGEGEVVAEIRSVLIEFEGAPAVLAFARDVTEARRAQRELERTQRLAALGTLVAGVAHEVNNPLAFATFGVEVLRRHLDGATSEVTSALASVAAGLDRVAVLVRDLRTFARADDAPLRPVALGEVLATALRMTGPAIRPRARIEADPSAFAGLPTVLGQSGRLEQVFVNVLINAAQAFAADDLAANVVRVRAEPAPGEVAIVVEDNGRGIAEEHVQRVFDPFFTTKPAGTGTGLGLAICHAIVAQHGGRITLRSEIGKGTAVTIALPARDTAAVPPPSRPAEPTPTRRARVLVVDDEPLVAALLRDLLQPRHDVTVATTGATAEELLARGPSYDVVLCDLTMPDVPGATLYERVRARAPELAARFVFMSGGLFTPDVLERLGGPGALRLEKPFRAAEVEAILARCLVP